MLGGDKSCGDRQGRKRQEVMWAAGGGGVRRGARESFGGPLPTPVGEGHPGKWTHKGVPRGSDNGVGGDRGLVEMERGGVGQICRASMGWGVSEIRSGAGHGKV